MNVLKTTPQGSGGSFASRKAELNLALVTSASGNPFIRAPVFAKRG